MVASGSYFKFPVGWLEDLKRAGLEKPFKRSRAEYLAMGYAKVEATRRAVERVMAEAGIEELPSEADTPDDGEAADLEPDDGEEEPQGFTRADVKYVAANLQAKKPKGTVPSVMAANWLKFLRSDGDAERQFWTGVVPRMLLSMEGGVDEGALELDEAERAKALEEIQALLAPPQEQVVDRLP